MPRDPLDLAAQETGHILGCPCEVCLTLRGWGTMREDDHNPWSQLADLRRRLVEAEGQRDHYARRALEAERKCSVYESSLVMLAKELDRPREDGSA